MLSAQSKRISGVWCEQVSAGRPIPVLPQHTFPGNVVLSSRATSGLSPPVLPDLNLERLVLGHLAAAAKEALYALADAPSSASDDGRAVRADTSDGSVSDQFSGLRPACQVDPRAGVPTPPW